MRVVLSRACVVLAVLSAGCFGRSPEGTADGGWPDGEVPGYEAGGEVPGKPVVEVSETTVDFGMLDCGGVAGTRTLNVRNAGGGTLTWGASLGASSAFEVSPSSGSLRGGEVATLTITAKAVPASSEAGQVENATLAVQTNDAAKSKVELPVTRTAAGATLTLTPESADFGLFPLNQQAPDLALSLKNTGNKPASVTLGAPALDAFAAAWTGAPSGVELAPGSAMPGLAARFRPTTTTALTTSAPIQVQGAVCGASAKSVTLSGQGSNGIVGVTPASLAFGSTNCGARAANQTLRISNTGNGPVSWQASMRTGGAYYSLNPASGTVAAGGEALVTVVPVAIPSTSPTTANLYAGEVEITTSAIGDTTRVIPLSQTAQGARLAFNPGQIAFGNVPISTSQTGALSLVNEGNLAANVVLATGAPFGVNPSTSTALSAGGTLSATASYSPTATGSHTGSINVTAPGAVLCAPLPAGVALSGTGTNGALSLSASSFDFGATACGATAGAQTLTLRNVGSAPFDWSAALARGAGSPYAIGTSGGTLAPGATATVAVTPRAIPQTSAVPGNYGDTLRVTTTIPGDTPHDVGLTQSARGAILRFSQTAAIDFGSVPQGSSQSASFSVINDGNAAANITLGTGDNAFALNPAARNLAGGASAPITATFTSRDANLHTSAITMGSSGAPLCAPLPSALPVRAQGTNGGPSITPASISFGSGGFQNCGTQAAAQNVVIANNGNGAFDITSIAFAGTNPGYTVSQPSTTRVNPGTSVTLTVTPPAIPSSVASIVSNGFGGTLRIQTNNVGTNSFDVALNLTARGAILGVTPAPVAFADTAYGGSRNATVTVTNSGNAPATVFFTEAGQSPNAFAVAPVSPGQTVSATSTLASTFTFTPPNGGDYTATASLNVAGGTPLCRALPGAVTMQGRGLIGAPVLSVSSLTFGQVACATSPGQGRFRISNTGDASLRIDDIVAESGNYVASPRTADIPVGGFVDVSVNGSGVRDNAGAIADRLVVQAAIPNGQRFVTTAETVMGAQLVFTPNRLTFQGRAGAAMQMQTYTVRNIGNMTINMFIDRGQIRIISGDPNAVGWDLIGTPSADLQPGQVTSAGTVVFVPRSQSPGGVAILPLVIGTQTPNVPACGGLPVLESTGTVTP